MIKNVLLILLLIFVIFIITMVILTLNQNSQKKSSLVTLKGLSDKKALVIFQPSNSSLSFDTANEIAKTLNESGYEVTINHPGSFAPNDLSQYNIAVFGSAVYAGTLAKPLNQYISTLKNIESTKIALYSCGGSDKTNLELTNLNSKYKLNSSNLLKLASSNSKEINKKKAADFVMELLK